MTVVFHEISKLYSFLNDDIADPRTKDLFLIGTLWRAPLLIMFYLYIVKVLGPKFMEERQPYKLNRIIQIYNVLQIIFNLYLCYLTIDLTWLRGYDIRCEPVDYSYAPIPLQISRGVWYYFLLKILDLMDTLFFVLKKKQSHVSFLHVYHHGGMVLCAWLGTKYLAGGHGIFLGTINTFVHSIMYTYYLLSSMKIHIRIWKKYITQLQMIQFFMISCHFILLVFSSDCGFPKWIALAVLPQNIFMFMLFGEFYYNAYIYKKPTSAAAPTKTAENSVSGEIVLNGKLKEQ